MISLILLLLFTDPILNYDFGSSKSGSNWLVINDGVMGGRSVGNAYLSDNRIHFEGAISFANNGGFASLRSNRLQLDLSDAKAIEIRYRLEGLDFAMMFEQYNQFYRPYFSYPLDKTDGQWVTKIISVEQLYQTRMGDYTGKTFDKKKSKPFRRLGFISKEKKESSFTLEIDYISIY